MKRTVWLGWVAIGLGVAGNLLAVDTPPCGNPPHSGVSAPPENATSKDAVCQTCNPLVAVCVPPRGKTPVANTNPFNPYTGNVHRDITDLELWAGAGEHRLHWTRYLNSRFGGGPNLFGNSANWRHSYQWEIADTTNDSQGRPRFNVYLPDGSANLFTRISVNGAQATWVSTAAVTDRMLQDGADYVLQRSNGWRYNFRKYGSGNSAYYLMESFLDSQGNVYTFTYDASRHLTRVTEPAGRYLQINYTTVDTVGSKIIGVGNITSTPPAGQWSEITVTRPESWRYVRYVGPNNNKGDIAEFEAYGNNQAVKLTGTAFGTDPADAPGTEYDKASDGNTATYFRYGYTTKAFTGIDFGSGVSNKVTKIKYYPRAGYEGEMVGGQFEVFNTWPGTITVIASVQTSDGRTVSYDYSPMTDPADPTLLWQDLVAANYDDGTQARYTYAQLRNLIQPLVTQAIDPRYAGSVANVQYEYYNLGAYGAVGQLHIERNGTNGQAMATAKVVGPNITGVEYSNGAIMQYKVDSATGGQPYYLIDAIGRRTDFTYDQGNAGYLVQTKDAFNRTTTYVRSPYGRSLSVTNTDGNVESWTRDSLELPLTHTDALGRTTTYTRDAQHRITRVDHPDTSFEEFTYNAFGQVLTHRQRNSGVVAHTYDARGLLTQSQDPLGRVTSYSYTTNDLMAAVTDARGNTTSFAYNERGQLTNIQFPGGATRASSSRSNQAPWSRQRSMTTPEHRAKFMRSMSCWQRGQGT